VRRHQGKSGEAEALLTKSLEGCRRLLGEGHPETLNVTHNLATQYRIEGKYAEAELQYTKVLEIRQRLFGETHRETRETMAGLSLVYYNRGRLAEAEALRSKLVQLDRRLFGDDAPNTLTSMSTLAEVYRVEGKYTEAEALLIKLVEMARRSLGAEDPKTLAWMNDLAGAYRAEGRSAEAETVTLDGSLLDRTKLDQGPGDGAAAAPKPPPALSVVFVGSTAGNTKSMFTGEWETDFPGPLSVDLKIDGTKLTGTVGKLPIFDGVVDGNTMSFKVSAGADRTITVTGTVEGNKIDFSRYVHVVPNGR